MKKIYLFIIGILNTLPMLSRDFEYTFEGQTLTYTVLDEEAKTCETKAGSWINVVLPGNSVEGALVIPSTVNDGETEYTVTQIGEYSFMSTDLTSVIMPSSVTYIGYEAFLACINLSSVKIGESVVTIGSGAFKSCYSLENIEIPNSVTSIGQEAFFDCRVLNSVRIGVNVSRRLGRLPDYKTSYVIEE